MHENKTSYDACGPGVSDCGASHASDNGKHPEISWSLLHPVRLDPAYMEKVIRHAKGYRVDSFEICGECHNPYGGLDGLITYDIYPEVHVDTERVLANRYALRKIAESAHQSGRSLYYWHREIMVPVGLTSSLPGLLDENGEFDLLGNTFNQLIRYKINEALSAIPELDGLVLTLTEADYSVIHNSNPDRYPPKKVVAHIVKTFCDELSARKKHLILRSFGSIAQDYEDIFAGAAKAAEHCSFEIETKITPYDFVPFLPANPFLRKIPGTTAGAECDCLGEFLGAGYLPAANVERIVTYVREAQNKGINRFALRLDRIANTIFDSAYEINLYAYHRAIDDQTVTADIIWKEWAEKHWPDCPQEMTDITAKGIQAVEKINFIDGNVMFHMFPLDPDMKWIKAGGIFALFKENVSLKWQSGIWSILSENNTPASRNHILQEKDEAIQIAIAQLEKLQKLKKRLEPSQFQQAQKEWNTALQVARFYRAFCQCVCAYFDDLEVGHEKPYALLDAIHAVTPLFAAYLSTVEMETTAVLPSLSAAIDHHAMSPRRNPIKTVYAAPLWAIIKSLRSEYTAEWNGRNAWKQESGVSDVIPFGAITDEWRIRRYMHASHSHLHNGRPARVVANRVFPNGYIEFELKAPSTPRSKLILEADPLSARSLKITINGQSQIICLVNGQVEIPVETEGKETFLIRLEKAGADYPRVYLMAAASVNTQIPIR